MLGAAVLGAAVLLTGCASHDTGSTRHPLHTGELTTQSWRGQAWTLTLSNDNANHQWCWTLTGSLSSGAGGFSDPHDGTSGPSDSQPLDGSHDLEYGPAPVGTARMVLVSTPLAPSISQTTAEGTTAGYAGVPVAGPPVTTTPHPLPAWAPAGLWWACPVAAGIWEPHFYDDTGHELAPKPD